MEPIELYETIVGYSQPTVTSPIATSDDKVNPEAVGRYLFRLAEENEDLKKYKTLYEAELEDKENYKQRYQEKCEECDDERRERKRLKEENRQLREQLENGIPHLDFLYNFDVTDFNKDMSETDIKLLMDVLLELVEMPFRDGYLIGSSMELVPIYIFLMEKGLFALQGKSSNDDRHWGLTALCNCWDNNIVGRVVDEKRKIELRSDYAAIKSELSKQPWKGASSCSWRNLYDNCNSKNGRNSKKKEKLCRAVNIQKRLEELLKQIPALRGKRF